MAKVGLLNAICAKLKTDVNEPGAEPVAQNSSNKNGQDTPYSSFCSSPLTGQDLSNHASLDLSTHGTPAQDSQDSPRKNRRKAAAPRCLKSYEEETYQKDELEEFEANNKDVDFAAYAGDLDENSNKLDDDDGERFVDGSDGFDGDRFRNDLTDDEDDDRLYAKEDSDVDQDADLSPDVNSSDENNAKIHEDKPNTDDFGAIDLSVQKSRPKKPRNPSPLPKVTNHVPVNLKAERRLSGSIGKNSGEAADLKDYAESTMNELLSMYGLSEDSGAIAKNVPLQNFSSGRILERHVGGLHNGRPVKRTEGEGRNAHLYAKYAEGLTKGFSVEATSNNQPHIGKHDDNDRDTETPPSVDASNHSNSKSGSNATNSPASGKFVESAAYIRACFNKDMAPSSETKSPTESLSGKLLPDYAKYIKRFNGFEDCKGTHCQDMMYREHYHCMDCSFKVFIKKEEMIRHFKWHKKRDESLQHGFMRYSPLDDCEDRFGECTHNKKQTHYHCLQSGCNKVYISTSDVQMHANYHRKDSAIIQEGFQRFRATEDCGTTKCQFYGQRTTHFHCRRHGCEFTFKNKADMEKHKTYHQKDEVLSKDGFKKFMKYEHCSYSGCKYSKISNHIHCIRTGCNYVLHSTGQLYSHKRKHERRDFEFAYKRFKQESGDDKGCSSNDGSSIGVPSGAPSPAPPTQVRPIAPRQTPQLPHGLVLPQPLSLPQQQAMLSHAQKALMTAISLQSHGGKPIQEQQNDPEYMDLEDLKNFDTKVLNSGTSTPESVSPPPTIHPAHPHSKFSLTAEMRRQQLQSAFARYASVLKNAELSDSLSLPIPNFMAKRRSEDAASHTVTREDVCPEADSDTVTRSDSHTVTHSDATTVNHSDAHTVTRSDAVIKEERESPVPGPLHVKQEPDEVPQMPPGGEQLLLNRPLPKIMEKKERDESWKKYMIRYTANDPCRARCSMLYKDHYHCNVEGCDVMFYTKERVREHARLHDQDEKVTELTFHTSMADHPCCVEGCSIKGQKHYHCLWPECDHVICVTEPPLTRLKHHRYHEQQRTSNNVRWRMERTAPSNDGLLRRKRGRPPKYPKDEIPLVPKVNVTENALYETSTPLSVKVTREMFLLSSTKIVNGFKMFEGGYPCPDQLCAYFMKEHYHCVRPRCHHVTNSPDVMNLHAREFHNYVSIMEGFEFFDRGVNCRRPHCQNNKTNRHFHCVRPRCDYSFVRHSTMFQHDKKHHDGYKQPKPTEERDNSPSSPLDDLKSKTIIKASGTFYPMSTIPHKPIAPKSSSGIPQPVPIKVEPSLMRPVASIPPFMTNQSSANSSFFVPMASAASMMNLASMPAAIPIFTAPIMAFPPASVGAPVLQPPSTPTSSATSGEITLQQASAAAEALKDLESSTQDSNGNHAMESSLDPNNPLAGQKSLPLTVLLQQKSARTPQMESWHSLRSKMHYVLNQNCGRPFCKLKKRDHYHCFDCNQAFSDPERLKTHVGRHGIKFERNKNPKFMVKSPGSSRSGAFDDEDSSSHASDLNSSLNLNGEEFSNMMAHAQKDIPEIGNNDADIDNEATNDTMDGSYGNLEIDLDSSSEMNSSMEDSNSRRSSRKRTSTRGREDYVDADAVIVKQRRVTSPRVYKDEPVPDGYTRYWAHEDCGRRGCSYRQSTTHFHCRRKSCGFGICSRVRIEQHTLRHQRIDKITGDDFEQYRANLECGFQKCLYSNQATHFHCLKCSFTCTDTIKVTTHRKQHNKKDFFISQGFQKYSQSQNCKQNCKHNQRQTHYHCIVCGSPVVGQSQMAPHRLKHAGLGRFQLVNMTDSVAAKAKGGNSSSAAVS